MDTMHTNTKHAPIMTANIEPADLQAGDILVARPKSNCNRSIVLRVTGSVVELREDGATILFGDVLVGADLLDFVPDPRAKAVEASVECGQANDLLIKVGTQGEALECRAVEVYSDRPVKLTRYL